MAATVTPIDDHPFQHLPSTPAKAFKQRSLRFHHSNVRANDIYHPAIGSWSISAWVKNVENTARVEALATDSIYGQAPGSIQPPRTYGLRLGFKFR